MPATHWMGLSITSRLFWSGSMLTKFVGNSFNICYSISELCEGIFLIWKSTTVLDSIIFESIWVKEKGSSSSVAPSWVKFNFSYYILLCTYSSIFLSLYLMSTLSISALHILKDDSFWGWVDICYTLKFWLLSESIARPLNCLRFVTWACWTFTGASSVMLYM